MTTSFASISGAHMELTPMRVSFKAVGATGSTDLGGTLGNVKVSMAYKKSPIHADQLGKTKIDDRVSSIEVKIETELAEILNKDLWPILFPHGTKVSGGVGFAGKSAFDFLAAIGDSSLAKAGELKLHPLSQADAVLDYDYTIYKACSTAESEVTYAADGQAKMKIVWQAYPDTTVTPNRFLRFGDKDLV